MSFEDDFKAVRQGIRQKSARSKNQLNNNYYETGGQAMLSHPLFLDDLRQYAREYGKTFYNDNDLVTWWYSDRRNVDASTTGALVDMGAYETASDEAQAYRSRLARAWEAAPARDLSLRKVVDYALPALTDPLNLIGFGSGAVAGRGAYLTARGAGAGTSAARKAALKRGASVGALGEAAAGSISEGVFSTVDQTRQIQQGVRDEFSGQKVLQDALMGGAIGGAIGAPLGAIGGRMGADALRRESIAAGRVAGRTAEREVEQAASAGATSASSQSSAQDDPELMTPPATRLLPNPPVATPEGELNLLGGQANPLQRPQVSNITPKTPEEILTGELGAVREEIVRIREEMASPEVSTLERQDLLERHEELVSDLATIQKDLSTRQQQALIFQEKEAKVQELQRETEGLSQKIVSEGDPEIATELQTALRNKTAELEQARGELELERNVPGSTVDSTITTVRTADGQLISNPALPLEGEVPGQRTAAAQQPEAVPAPKAEAPDAGSVTPEAETTPIRATKKALELLNRFNADPQKVEGTGKDGQITTKDARKAVRGIPEPEPELTLEQIISEGILFDEEGKPLPPLDLSDTPELATPSAPPTPADARLDEAAQVLRSQMDAMPGLENYLSNPVTAEAIFETWPDLTPDVRRYARKNIGKVIETALGSRDDAPMGKWKGPDLSRAETEQVEALVKKSYDNFLRAANVIPALKSMTPQELASNWKKVEGAAYDRFAAEVIQRRARRLGDSAAKAGETLQKGPVTAGQTSVTSTDPGTGEKKTVQKTQSILKSGTDVGDGYTVIGRAPRGSEWTLDEAQHQYLMDARQNKAKPIYEATARGGEVVYGQDPVMYSNGSKGWRKKRATRNQAIYYVPATKQFYADLSIAEINAGLRKRSDLVVAPTSDATTSATRAAANKSKAKAKARPATAAAPIDALDVDAELQAIMDKFQKDRDLGAMQSAIADLKARQDAVDDQAGISSADEVVDTSAAPTSLPLQALPEGLENLPAVRTDGWRLTLIKRDKTNPAQPADPTVRGNFPRIVSKSQEDAKNVVARLLGPRGKIEEWTVGYVAPGVRSSDPRILSLFQPIDPKNEIAGAQKATSPVDTRPTGYEFGPEPLDMEDPFAIQETLRPFNTLTSTQRRAYNRAVSIVIGEKKDGGVNSLASKVGADPINIEEVQLALFRIDASSWTEVSGEKVAQSHRLADLKALNGLLADMAPDGIRLPSTDLEDSISTLNQIVGETAPELTLAMRQLLEMAPGDARPIFAQAGNRPAYAMSPFSVNFNQIKIRAEEADMFTLAHEYGHWAYHNILSPAERAQFWYAIEKYYDEGGDLSIRGADLIRARSPITPMGNVDGKPLKASDIGYGPGNSLDSPNEFFANQFALYLMGREDLIGYKDKSFWGKVAQKVQKVIDYLSGKNNPIDPDLIPLFERIAPDPLAKEKLSYVKAPGPKTPTGRALQTRYALLKDEKDAIEDRLRSGDLMGVANSMNEIARQFTGMVITKREARKIAEFKGEPFNEKHPGSFKALKDVMKLMRAGRRAINDTLSLKPYAHGAGDDLPQFSFGEAEEDKIIALWDTATSYKPDGSPNGYSLSDIVNLALGEMRKVYRNIEEGEINILGGEEIGVKTKGGEVVSGGGLRGRAKSFYRLKNNSKKASQKKAAERAKAEATAGTQPPKGSQGKPSGAVSKMTDDQLLELYQKNQGSRSAQRAAHEIMRRENAKRPVPDRNPRAEIKQKTLRGLLDGFMTAHLQGDPAARDEIVAEMARRERINGDESNIGPFTSTISDAVRREQILSGHPEVEPGVPASMPYPLRNMLTSLTHRDPMTQVSARTIMTRLMNLGLPVEISTRTPEYSKLRTAIRRTAHILRKNQSNIDPAARVLSRLVAQTQVVDPDGRRVVARAAEFAGLDYDEFVARAIEARNGPNRFDPEQFADAFEPEDAGWQSDLFAAISTYHEATAYVVNGLIFHPEARASRADLTAFGDMIRGPQDPSTSMTSTITSGIQGRRTFFDLFDQLPTSAQKKIDEWSNGEVYLINGLDRHDRQMGDAPADRIIARSVTNGAHGPGVYLGHRPQSLRDASIFEGQRPQTADGLRNLSATRERLSQLTVQHLDAKRRGDLDEVSRLSGEIKRVSGLEYAQSAFVSRMGGPKTDAMPVTVASGDYLDLSKTNLGILDDGALHPFTAEIIREIGARTNKQPRITGPLTGEALSDLVASSAPGGDRSILVKVAKSMGYLGFKYPGGAVVFNPRNVAHPHSERFFFEDLEEVPNVSGPATPFIQAVLNDGLEGVDVAEMGSWIERTGSGPSLGQTLMDFLRGRATSKANINDARQSARIFWTTMTNGQIARKAGLNYVADFFESPNGGSGHYERVTSMTGAFVQPIHKMLLELPDAGNMFSRWFEQGPALLVKSGTNAALGAAGFVPRTAPQQPQSHARIITALRTDAVSSLNQQERQVARVIRKKFEEALAVMRDAGLHVGQIDPKRYVPQIWSRDLIESDAEGFTAKLAKYFQAESLARTGKEIDEVEAIKKAGQVRDNLLDEDGYMAPPANQREGKEDHLDFKRMLRLDDPEFARFLDPQDPSSLYSYLENDLSVITSKYFSGVARRVDHMKAFGYSNHGFHDYVTAVSEGVAGIEKMLTSSKVYMTGGKVVAGDDVRLVRNVEDIFPAPFPTTEQGKAMAREFTKKIVRMVRSGADRADVQRLVQGLAKGDPEQRQNFRRRAEAITAALYDYQETAGAPMPVQLKNLEHAMSQMQASLRKPIGSRTPYTEGLTGISKGLRAFNSVSLLGFTTLTSLGDLALPIISSGDLRAATAAWKNFAKDPAYRDMIRNVGAAVENVVHERMIHGFGVDASKFSNGFFSTTLLTQWTTMNRNIGAAVGYEHFRAQQRIALRDGGRTRAGRIARRILDEYGLKELYQPSSGQPRTIQSVLDSPTDPAYEAARLAIIRITNESIFTPNPNDIPIWAQTPLGMLAFQFKSFPLMMTRLAGRVIKQTQATEAWKRGDIRILTEGRWAPFGMFLMAGPAMAGASLVVKDVVQVRGGDDNRQAALRERRASATLESLFGYEPELHGDFDKYAGWYMESFMHMGGLGLIGDLAYTSAEQMDNGAYGQNRIASAFLGPTYGTFMSGLNIIAGITDGNEASNAKERTAVRETLRRAPIFGGLRGPVEGVVDAIAGTPASRRSGTSNDLGLDLKLNLDLGLDLSM